MAVTKPALKFGLLFVVLIALGAFAYVLVAVRGTFAPFRSSAAAGGNAILVGAPGHRIAGRVYHNGSPGSSVPLIVVLHGDAPFINPGYQYDVAVDLADTVQGTRVVALTRPGYADAYGAKSDGDRGFASGDTYTLNVTKELAAAVQSLKEQWEAPSVILVGHSGGAAVAANIAALNPGLVQHVFLVARPCDVPAFRRHMARMQWSPTWLLPTDSLSPMRTLDRMDRRTKVTAITGANDPVALPEYAQRYIAKAKSLGIPASMIVLPDKGHEILDDPAVITRVSQSVRDDY